MAKKEKKKTPISFLYIIIIAMLAVYAVQMIFPTNLGKTFDKFEENAVSITVTATDGKTAGKSYTTDSRDKIHGFGDWADGKTMRNRSLADGITAEALDQIEYNFAIKAVDGTYSSIVIDERGYVHVGAELYKISEDPKTFIEDLEKQLRSWEQ